MPCSKTKAYCELLSTFSWTSVTELEVDFDEGFRQLLKRHRLTYLQNKEERIQPDSTDKVMCKMAVRSLDKQKNTLVSLPDQSPHRIPIIFAFLLMYEAMKLMSKKKSKPDSWMPPQQSIIYFGPKASIRHHLEKTYLNNDPLSKLIGQTNLKNSGEILTKTELSSNWVPHVVFAYRPKKPEKILAKIDPKWCFVDFGRGKESKWTKKLTDAIKRNNFTSVALSRTPLPALTKKLKDRNWFFFKSPFPTFQVDNVDNNDELNGFSTVLKPVYIEGNSANQSSDVLKKCYNDLYKIAPESSEGFIARAVSTVWKYLRRLERLTVPYDFHEAEQTQFSIKKARKTAKLFLEEISEDCGDSYKFLYRCFQSLKSLEEGYEEGRDPPLWKALPDLCFEPPSSRQSQLVVFHNHHLKDLFGNALVAKFGILPKELTKIGTYLTDLEQIRRWQLIREGIIEVEETSDFLEEGLLNNPWVTIYIGYPLPSFYYKFTPLLKQEHLQFLLLKHQLSAFKRHIERWTEKLNNGISNNLKVIEEIFEENEDIIHSRFSLNQSESRRLKLEDPTAYNTESYDRNQPNQAERNKIFNVEESIGDLESVVSPPETGFSSGSEERRGTNGEVQEDSYLKEVMEVHFEEGTKIFLNPDEKIHFVVNCDGSSTVEKRYAKSLSEGDTILYIPEQKHQNLKELVISRIDDHPDIQLCLALIRKWQDTLIEAFRASSLTKKELHHSMKSRGSTISLAAIKSWLSRKVMTPRDKEDLIRLKRILNIPFTEQKCYQIHEAKEKIAGVHRSFSRQLNSWLDDEAPTSFQNGSQQMISDELGLQMEDFEDAFLELQVKQAYMEKGLFLKSQIGKLSE